MNLAIDGVVGMVGGQSQQHENTIILLSTDNDTNPSYDEYRLS